MNNDLISRNTLIADIKRVYCTGCNSYDGVRCRACGTGDALDMVEDAPAVDAVPRDEYDLLLKRFRHLLKSDFIASFDEYDPKTGGYKRDIAEADKDKDLQHGHWLRTSAYPHHIYCSIYYTSLVQNEEIIERYKIPTNFCPNCGAKMDKKG